MDPIQLPPEAWAAVGVFLTGHFGVIWSGVKGYFKRERDLALLNQRLDFMNQSFGEMKAKQDKLQKDLDGYFNLLRKYIAKDEEASSGD